MLELNEAWMFFICDKAVWVTGLVSLDDKTTLSVTADPSNDGKVYWLLWCEINSVENII